MSDQLDSRSNGDAPFRQWLVDARGGSDEAVGQLIRSCQAYLMLIANQELGSHVRGKIGASDAVQSALIMAHANIGRFEGDTREDFQRWLRAILLNELKMVHRRFTTDKRNVNREVAEPQSGPAAATIDPQPSPPSLAAGNEEAAALRAAMEKLPADYRQVIVLRTWEQLPFEEVGRRLNRSEGAAKKLWTRAMRQLKAMLGEGRD